MRVDIETNIKARASAPTVVMAMASKLMGPYAASEVGRLKIPTPMMLPTISAVACESPSVPAVGDCARGSDALDRVDDGGPDAPSLTFGAYSRAFASQSEHLG